MHSVTDRQTDRQHYDAKSRSCCVQYDQLKSDRSLPVVALHSVRSLILNYCRDFSKRMMVRGTLFYWKIFEPSRSSTAAVCISWVYRVPSCVECRHQADSGLSLSVGPPRGTICRLLLSCLRENGVSLNSFKRNIFEHCPSASEATAL